MRARLVLGAALAAALALAAAPEPRPGGGPAAGDEVRVRPPRFTRDEMEAMLAGGARWLFVYGTRDPAAETALRARAHVVAARLFGLDSSAVVADRDVAPARLAAHAVFLFGGARENRWTDALSAHLPVAFERGGFRWQERLYDRPGDAIHLVYPHPYAPERLLLLVAANSVEALSRRGAGFAFGGEDWRITRNGELVRSGAFAHGGGRPWRYDAALDRDRERERSAWAAALVTDAGPALVVRASGDRARAAAVRREGEALLARLDRLGFAARAGAPPVTLTLYGSLEDKGRLTRDTRPEHVAADGAHAAPIAHRPRLDLVSVAAARLVALGADPDSRFLMPAAGWLAGAWGGEPLERAVARLHFGRLLPSAAEAASRDARWRSPLVMGPARALLARAVHDVAGARAPRAALALLGPSAPGALDSLARAAGIERARLERRYAALADSIARAGTRPGVGRRLRPWRAADGFQRGVCLAHTTRLEDGYLSATCAREIERLRAMGCDWISLTPFGYLRSQRSPEIWPTATASADEESDEAVAEAAARAHALGMRVWLKPHLWTRGWVGELDFAPQDWPRFWDHYRAFVLHHALLAEREGIAGLFIGHELVSATRRDPERWRALIADVRRVYSGTLTYGANWGEELRQVPFWDALDVVAVSFYDPLATRADAPLRELEAGARRALAGVREIGRRAGRPVLLSELGYASSPGAAVRPWEESWGASDGEAQRRCWEAIVRALEREDWVAGVFVWKWFTSPGFASARDTGFSVRGKPAEAVIRRALESWRERPVRVPV